MDLTLINFFKVGDIRDFFSKGTRTGKDCFIHYYWLWKGAVVLEVKLDAISILVSPYYIHNYNQNLKKKEP